MLRLMSWRVMALVVAGWMAARYGAPVLRAQQQQSLLVESARVDKNGRVHLRWTGQAEQMVPRDRGAYCVDDPQCEDVSADQLKISPDRHSVGWAAGYESYGQNYPLDWTLVIARNGRVVQRINPVRTVADWTFEDGDRYAAVFTDTPHGDMAPLCELFDLRTGKRVAAWDVVPGRKPPKWADPLAQDFGQ